MKTFIGGAIFGCVLLAFAWLLFTAIIPAAPAFGWILLGAMIVGIPLTGVALFLLSVIGSATRWR